MKNNFCQQRLQQRNFTLFCKCKNPFFLGQLHSCMERAQLMHSMQKIGLDTKCVHVQLNINEIFQGPNQMWLMDYCNPSKFEQSWECTFLNGFTHMSTKWTLKTIIIIGLQSWQLGSTANPASNGQIGHAIQLQTLKINDENCFSYSFWVHMGKAFEKSSLPTLFKFARVRAAQ